MVIYSNIDKTQVSAVVLDTKQKSFRKPINKKSKMKEFQTMEDHTNLGNKSIVSLQGWIFDF